ncbi:MAG: hypothetical protein CMD18_08790 [Flavobacteriales bacterium]|nr:hypothetical protein [Flavobacteriales bacterium]|tara:strand:+ start:3609 stop:4913 length:1305 start_codon:yes stop_codon:yes gene_type:complete
MKKIINLLVIFLINDALNGQVLNLEEAISIALSNNHGILIAQQEEAALKTGIHPGAAGLLPTLSANSAASYSYSSTNQEFNGGIFPAIEGMEASQNNQSAKVAASYLLFNGGARIKLYSKLKTSGSLYELQTKITIESTLIQVINAYCEVVRVQNQLELVQKSMEISLDRLRRTQIINDFGNASKLDLLNAKVDLNFDSSNVLSAELNLRKAKNELNYLLGRKIALEFEVNQEVVLPELSDASDYINKAKENNTLALLSNIQLDLADIDKKISKSNFMPVLSTNLDYGYSGSANDVGVFKSASSVGYTGSVSLKWNLFDGFKKQKALEKAQISIEVNTNKQQQILLNIEKEVQNYYDALLQNSKLLMLQTENRAVAKLNLERSENLLKNGSITNMQFRQAQLNLLQIDYQINNLRYTIKVLDYQLLRMINELVK